MAKSLTLTILLLAPGQTLPSLSSHCAYSQQLTVLLSETKGTFASFSYWLPNHSHDTSERSDVYRRRFQLAPLGPSPALASWVNLDVLPFAYGQLQYETLNKPAQGLSNSKDGRTSFLFAYRRAKRSGQENHLGITRLTVLHALLTNVHLTGV